MKYIRLVVLDKLGVLLDVRRSPGGVRFSELTPVDGFPRELSFQDEYDIEIDGYKEILYIRDLREDCRGKFLNWIYRVEAPEEDGDTKKGYIEPSM